MAYRFSNKILSVETVRAYYVGDRLLVEVDIVLPPECRLQEAHDIGEALQDALERMDIVERAFVHLDYTAEHEIEHRRVVDGVGFGQ
jgi:divalent metal cation (Fe/Co/Zn/Cd) transporter